MSDFFSSLQVDIGLLVRTIVYTTHALVSEQEQIVRVVRTDDGAGSGSESSPDGQLPPCAGAQTELAAHGPGGTEADLAEGDRRRPG